MVHRIPRQLPALATMLDDLQNPKTPDLARWLGVTPRTAARWVATDHAPRPVLLALFWCTRWGRSELECAAVNDAARLASLADAMGCQVVALQRELARVLAAGDFGSANAPTARALPQPGPVLRLAVRVS